MTTTLHIAAEKNYSSWSLRGWLVLRWGGIAFNEVLITLAQPGYGESSIAQLLTVAPNGQVPSLDHDGVTIWDSLAIAEWAAEQNPGLWPHDPAMRARARSVTAEMHSGFLPIRRDLSMNIVRRCTVTDLPAETRRSIARMRALIADCLKAAHGGPWLFGERSIADAFFAPVATRFRTYGVTLDFQCQAWVDTVLSDRDFREWEAACIPDSWDHHGYSVIDGLHR